MATVLNIFSRRTIQKVCFSRLLVFFSNQPTEIIDFSFLALHFFKKDSITF